MYRVYLLSISLVVMIGSHLATATQTPFHGGVPNSAMDGYGLNPAKITDRSRSDRYGDFIRVVWPRVDSSVTELTFGKRAFFTASSFVQPALTVDELLSFVGNYFHQDRDFAVMRCKPSPEQRLRVQPILASWPNVFPAIASDFGAPGCSLATNDGERELCEIAGRYRDSRKTVYVRGLAKTLDLGKQMFGTPESTKALSDDYGIFPAFSGLGFTIQESATETGAPVRMTTADILRNAVIPEYLLKNSSLENAGCRCVQVPGDQDLHQMRVDPEYVWRFGKLDHGACRKLPTLWGGGRIP